MATPKTVTLHSLSTEVGAIGVQSYGGRVDQDDPNRSLTPEQWRGDMGQPGDAESMLRQDPMVKAAYTATAGPIIEAEWTVQPGSVLVPEGATDEQLERHEAEAQMLADFVSWALFERMGGTWKGFLQAATLFRHFGFSLFEQVWKMDTWNDRPVACLAKLAQRRQRTVHAWNLADTGEVDSVEQWRVTKDDQQLVTLEGDRIVHFVKDGNGNPEGVGLARPANFPWKVRQSVLKNAAIMIERTAAPTRRAVYSDLTPADDIAQLKQMAREHRSHERQHATFHESVKFEWEEAADPRAIQFAMEASEKLLAEIARAYGAMHLMTGSEGKGALSLDQSRKSTAAMMIESDAEYMADVLNRGDNAIIPRLIHFNWAPEEFVFGQIPMPVLTVSNIREPDLSALAALFTQGVQAGVLVPDKEVRDAYRAHLGLQPEPVITDDDADSGGRIPDPLELNEHIARLSRDGLIVADKTLENFLRLKHGLPPRAEDAPPPGDPARRNVADDAPEPDDDPGSGGKPPKPTPEPPETEGNPDDGGDVEPKDAPPTEGGTDGGGQALDSVPFAQAAQACGCSDCKQSLAKIALDPYPYGHPVDAKTAAKLRDGAAEFERKAQALALTDKQRATLQGGQAMSGRALRLEEQCLDLEGMADAKQNAADSLVSRANGALSEALPAWVAEILPLIRAGDVEGVAEFPPPELDFTEAVSEPLAQVTEAGRVAVESERARQRGDEVPEPPKPIEFPEQEGEEPEAVAPPLALADGVLDPNDLDFPSFARAQAAKMRRRLEADAGQTATSMAEQSALGGEVAEAEAVTESLIAQAQGGIKDITRSAIGAAFGQGRAMGIEDFRVEQEAAGLQPLVVYSNAAESQICDICAESDGEVLVVGSAEYDRLFPPNPGCLSTLGSGNFCNCVYTAAEEPVRDVLVERANQRRQERGQDPV